MGKEIKTKSTEYSSGLYKVEYKEAQYSRALDVISEIEKESSSSSELSNRDLEDKKRFYSPKTFVTVHGKTASHEVDYSLAERSNALIKWANSSDEVENEWRKTQDAEPFLHYSENNDFMLNDFL